MGRFSIKVELSSPPGPRYCHFGVSPVNYSDSDSEIRLFLFFEPSRKPGRYSGELALNNA